MTALEVWERWLLLERSQQNSKTAREYSSMCGMKSMAEVETAALFERKKIKYGYEEEHWKYQYEPQTYTPDFKVGNVYVEIKGKATKETRNKLLAVKRCNPERIVIIRFLKGQNKITAGSKTTYLDWFKKKGFICFDWNEEREFLDFVKRMQPSGLRRLKA